MEVGTYIGRRSTGCLRRCGWIMGGRGWWNISDSFWLFFTSGRIKLITSFARCPLSSFTDFEEVLLE